MAYPIVRTDLMAGTVDPAKLRTFKYLPSNTATALNNGTVVLLDKIIADATTGAVPNREVWKAVTPAASSARKDLVLVATPELMYEAGKSGLDDFQNPANGLCRGYVFEENDIFSVTVDGVEAAAAIAVGDIVEVQAKPQMKIVKSATSGSTQIGKVIQLEQVGSKNYCVIRVC